MFSDERYFSQSKNNNKQQIADHEKSIMKNQSFLWLICSIIMMYFTRHTTCFMRTSYNMRTISTSLKVLKLDDILSQMDKIVKKPPATMKTLSSKLNALSKQAELALNEQSQIKEINEIVPSLVGASMNKLSEMVCAPLVSNLVEYDGEIKEFRNIQDVTSRDVELINKLNTIIAKFTDKGPQCGIFTDGSSVPNPGPGGWAAVCVDTTSTQTGSVQWATYGASPHGESSTNNRMELMAIAAALSKVPLHSDVVIYSDSSLVVKTFNEWAHDWERRNWVKKDGKFPKNLDMVKVIHRLMKERPHVKLQWIKAHDGSTWNEFADCLADHSRTNIC
jgi:ribonuclease HI